MADLIQKLLNSAEAIVVLEKNPAENEYRFAIPFAGDFARQKYDATLKIDSHLPEFQTDNSNRHWSFNESTEQVNGLSIPLLARLGRVLRGEGLELPDILDLIILDRKGKLTNDVYRDGGVAVYSDGEPNQETAKALIEKAKERGLVLPLLFGINELDYNVADGHTKIIFVGNPKRIVSGEEAVKVLEKFYKGNSGARRAFRGRGGDWGAYWGGFADSSACGLVDWLCAEGTRENLQEGYNNLFERKYNSEIAKLQSERKAEEQRVLEELKK